MNRAAAVVLVVFLALVAIFLAQAVSGIARVGGLMAERGARGERLAAEFPPDPVSDGGPR